MIFSTNEVRVPPGMSVQVSDSAPCALASPKLTLDGIIPSDWLIVDIDFPYVDGRRSQFLPHAAGGAGIPGEAFASGAADAGTCFRSLAEGETVYVLATYRGSRPEGEPFRCQLVERNAES